MICALCGHVLKDFSAVRVVRRGTVHCADQDACRARREAAERDGRIALGMDVKPTPGARKTA